MQSSNNNRGLLRRLFSPQPFADRRAHILYRKIAIELFCWFISALAFFYFISQNISDNTRDYLAVFVVLNMVHRTAKHILHFVTEELPTDAGVNNPRTCQ